jgi:hypothetical protein
MPHNILRRCDICGKYHASYRVPDPEGKTSNLCYSCWKARYQPATPRPTDRAVEQAGGKADSDVAADDQAESSQEDLHAS